MSIKMVLIQICIIHQLAGSLLIDLTTNDYQVSMTQIDDRNHCLKIYSPRTKRFHKNKFL